MHSTRMFQYVRMFTDHHKPSLEGEADEDESVDTGIRFIGNAITRVFNIQPTTHRRVDDVERTSG